MDTANFQDFNQIVAAIQEHPLWSHAGLITLLVSGVLLWVSGRRVMKPIFGVLGALVGGFLGHAIIEGMDIETMFGVPGEFVGVGIGAAIGLLSAVLIFRLALGVFAAFTLGGLAVLAASVFIQTTEPPPAALDEAGNPAALTESEMQELRESTSLDEDSASWRDELTLENAQNAASEPGKFVGDLYRGFKAELWDPLTSRDRALITATGLAGIVGGLALGVFAPRKTTAFVTAFAGAGMWLPSLYFLSQSLELPGKALLERMPIEWLVIWLVVSLTGVMIQWRGLKEKGKNAKPAKDDKGKKSDEEE